jgi:hypothetical protein
MDARHIAKGLEVGELALEVTPVPKQYMVEKLSPRGVDEPFDKGIVIAVRELDRSGQQSFTEAKTAA